MRFVLVSLALAATALVGCASVPPAASSLGSQQALDGLLAAERDLSAAAATRTPAEGIAAMFDEDVFLIAREGMIRGRAAATANLVAYPGNRGRFAHWATVRGGVSADGTHGFTYGYLDIDGGADPLRATRRYLSYWVKRRAGWRVLAFRQVLRPADEARMALQAPFVSAGRARQRDALAAAETAFSDRAQGVGLRAAFAEFGTADAVNIYGEKGFSIGREAIGAIFPDTRTSPVRWSSSQTFVAPSNDMGLSVGALQPNPGAKDAAPGEQPFFTVWVRDGEGRWRFIAE